MKIRCPTCGIEGYLQVRGHSARVRHYTGFQNGKRIYVYHGVKYSTVSQMDLKAWTQIS